MMKLTSISFSNYYAKPDVTLGFSGDGASIALTLSDAEAQRFLTFGYEIFQERQAELARGVANLEVPTLLAPPIPEVELVDPADGDDMPF